MTAPRGPGTPFTFNTSHLHLRESSHSKPLRKELYTLLSIFFTAIYQKSTQHVTVMRVRCVTVACCDRPYKLATIRVVRLLSLVAAPGMSGDRGASLHPAPPTAHLPHPTSHPPQPSHRWSSPHGVIPEFFVLQDNVTENLHGIVQWRGTLDDESSDTWHPSITNRDPGRQRPRSQHPPRARTSPYPSTLLLTPTTHTQSPT